MPVKSLPKKLVKRLRKVAGQIDRKLGLMKNIDHRQTWINRPVRPAHTTKAWGYRVREMNVQRNFPKTELVIKRTHDMPARELIQTLQEIVQRHNRQFTPDTYVLIEPKAVPISAELVAMAKTNAPSVDEILFQGIRQGTRRGKQFFEKLVEKNPGITTAALDEAAGKVIARTGIEFGNLLLLGVKKGKFVFMPLVDLE